MSGEVRQHVAVVVTVGALQQGHAPIDGRGHPEVLRKLDHQPADRRLEVSRWRQRAHTPRMTPPTLGR
jgi:hypothetical protein